jgi:hypothetical protein
MKKKSVSKKKKEEQIKEEKLEEEIEDAEKEISLEELTKIKNENNIQNFLISEEVKAPVLETIATQESSAINQFESKQKKEIEEERKIDYAVSNEPKYSAGTTPLEEVKKYETTFIPPSLTQREISGREFFIPMKSAWEEPKQISETPEEFEVFEMGRKRLPFEEEQQKYKKIKF